MSTGFFVLDPESLSKEAKQSATAAASRLGITITDEALTAIDKTIDEYLLHRSDRPFSQARWERHLAQLSAHVAQTYADEGQTRINDPNDVRERVKDACNLYPCDL